MRRCSDERKQTAQAAIEVDEKTIVWQVFKDLFTVYKSNLNNRLDVKYLP